MTPAQKRLLFPLRAPRAQTHAFWPFHMLAAAVDGYHDRPGLLPDQHPLPGRQGSPGSLNPRLKPALSRGFREKVFQEM